MNNEDIRPDEVKKIICDLSLRRSKLEGILQEWSAWTNNTPGYSTSSFYYKE